MVLRDLEAGISSASRSSTRSLAGHVACSVLHPNLTIAHRSVEDEANKLIDGRLRRAGFWKGKASASGRSVQCFGNTGFDGPFLRQAGVMIRDRPRQAFATTHSSYLSTWHYLHLETLGPHGVLIPNRSLCPPAAVLSTVPVHKVGYRSRLAFLNTSRRTLSGIVSPQHSSISSLNALQVTSRNIVQGGR